MCGIIGIIEPRGLPAEGLQALSKNLRHRGPDDEGFYLIDAHGIGRSYRGTDTIDYLSELPHVENTQPSDARISLIHRRLSILDLSPLGHQPMTTADEQHTIIYNGEVYNYKEIRAELEGRGRTFKSNTDTEVVLQAYLEWGAKCTEKFMGMWAFCIYDKPKQRLFLSRDRFGIKPLYYCWRKDRFAFASEIKTLLMLDSVKSDVDSQSFIEYLSFGTTSTPWTNLFSDIEDFPPGHNMIFYLDSRAFEMQRYYKLEDAYTERIAEAKQNPFEAFETAFQQSIEMHLRADVEIGSCLSGGLDSSAIVAFSAPLMQGQKFQTFTAAYQNKDIDESDYARLVADQFSNVDPHFTYPTADQFLRDIDKLIYYQDLPIGSTSIFAQWNVMSAARKNNIKVLLDGQGADEILGGYYNFAGIYVLEALRKGQFAKAIREYRALKKNFTPNMKSALARAFYYFLPERTQRKLRAKERLGMHFVGEEFKSSLANIDIPKRGGKNYRQHSLLSTDFGMYELLRYEDRNSMAYSIESRVPFLDHRLVELSIALKNDHKLHKGWTKYILRKTIENKLPEKVVWRKDKKGFVTPQQEWKNEVFPTILEYIKDAEIPSILNKSYILELCQKDISSNAHLSEFWRMYSVLKWIEHFKVNIR